MIIETRLVDITRFVDSTHSVPGGVGNWTFVIDFDRTYSITNAEYHVSKVRLFKNPFFKGANFFELSPNEH